MWGVETRRFSNINWKLHIALFPVYMLVLAALVAIISICFLGLIQFGWMGPIVGAVSLWFMGGLFYWLVSK